MICLFISNGIWLMIIQKNWIFWISNRFFDGFWWAISQVTPDIYKLYLVLTMALVCCGSLMCRIMKACISWGLSHCSWAHDAEFIKSLQWCTRWTYPKRAKVVGTMLEHIATSSVNVFEAGNPTMWGWFESHPFVVIWGWYGLVHDEVYHTYLYMCFHFFWSFHNFVMEMSMVQERISSRETLRGLFATWPHGPMILR